MAANMSTMMTTISKLERKLQIYTNTSVSIAHDIEMKQNVSSGSATLRQYNTLNIVIIIYFIWFHFQFVLVSTVT